MKQGNRLIKTVRYLLASFVVVIGLITLVGSNGEFLDEDLGGCPGSPPHAEFTAQPSRGPAPLEVFFDASASYDPDSTLRGYSWHFGDDTYEYNESVTATHIYTTPGTYSIELYISDNCHSSSVRQGITVEGSINATFSAQPTTGTAPLEVAFDASASSDQDGTIISYEWGFGDGQSGEGITTNHTYTSIGRYEAQLTVTNDVGATHSLVQEIKVEVPTATFTAQPISGMPPLEVAFNASSSSGQGNTIISYQWDFDDGHSGEGITINHTYTSIGLYYAQLTVTNDVGESDSGTQKIRVGAPTAAFTMQPTSGRAPLEVFFDASASFDQDGSIVSYEWSFGDWQFGEGAMATHTYTIPGTYTVRLGVRDNDDLYDYTTLEITVEAN